MDSDEVLHQQEQLELNAMKSYLSQEQIELGTYFRFIYYLLRKSLSIVCIVIKQKIHRENVSMYSYIEKSQYGNWLHEEDLLLELKEESNH